MIVRYINVHLLLLLLLLSRLLLWLRALLPKSITNYHQTVKQHFTAAEVMAMRVRRRDQLCNIYYNRDYMIIRTMTRVAYNCV